MKPSNCQRATDAWVQEKPLTDDLYPCTISYLISSCESTWVNYSAAIGIADEIVSGVLGYLGDLSVEPWGRWGGQVSCVAISSDKHTFESELNVEEVQGLLDLVNHGVGFNDFLRNGDTSWNEHVEDSGGSCGINAIVECLRFGCEVEAKQAKNNWVSWLVIEGVPDWNISVVESLREEFAALEVRKLRDEGFCKTE